jgi:hypothetical protein
MPSLPALMADPADGWRYVEFFDGDLARKAGVRVPSGQSFRAAKANQT